MSVIREYYNFFGAVAIFLRGSFHFIRTRDIKKQDQIIERYFQKMKNLWGLSVEISGLETVDKNDVFVIISNHQSLMDIPVLYHSLPLSIRMAAKAELFKIPVFGYVLNHGNFIPIHRNNSKKAISNLTKATELFNKNTCIFMAPEGTRSKDGELLPFKKGPFVLAIDHEKKILPVVISGTKEVVVKGSIRIKSNQKVQVTILPAIDTKGLNYDDRSELTERAQRMFQDELTRIKSGNNL